VINVVLEPLEAPYLLADLDPLHYRAGAYPRQLAELLDGELVVGFQQQRQHELAHVKY
jgi:hypothetical protein